jgi:hypothetical protein
MSLGVVGNRAIKLKCGENGTVSPFPTFAKSKEALDFTQY